MVDGVGGGATAQDKTWIPDWNAPVKPVNLDGDSNRSDPEKKPTDNAKTEASPVKY